VKKWVNAILHLFLLQFSATVKPNLIKQLFFIFAKSYLIQNRLHFFDKVFFLQLTFKYSVLNSIQNDKNIHDFLLLFEDSWKVWHFSTVKKGSRMGGPRRTLLRDALVRKEILLNSFFLHYCIIILLAQINFSDPWKNVFAFWQYL